MHPQNLQSHKTRWGGLGGTHFPLHLFQETLHHEKVSLRVKFDIQVIKYRFSIIKKCIFVKNAFV